MSLSHEQVLRLMAYADGELEGEERAEVDALLASNDEARCVVAAMQGSAVGEWVAHTHEERAVRAGADSIADAVMAKVEARPVVDLAAARARHASSRRTGAIVVGLLALAAGVALFIASGRESGTAVPSMPVASNGAPPGTHRPSLPPPTNVLPQAPSPAPAATVASGEEPPVEIESDSEDVSVYYVPTSPGAAANVNATSVVIWFDDTTAPKGK